MRAQVPQKRISNKKHSTVVGGSTAGLVRKCNGSILESQKAPVEQWTRWSAEGTALHTVMERVLSEGLSNKAMLAQFTGVELEQVELTADLLREKAIPAAEFIDRIVPDTADVLYEKKVSFPGDYGFPHIKGAFGTGDVLFDDSEHSGRVGGVDFKFGDGYIVEVEDNDQAMFYLSAAISCGYLPVVDEYEFWIFQPSAKLTPDKYATRCIFSYDQLVDFANDLADAVESKPQYETGAHCNFCKGKLSCKPYRNMITAVVETDIAGVTTHRLAELLNLLPAMQKVAEEVKAAALRNAQAGLEIPGYKLEPSEGNRTFKDETAALGALARLGMPADKRQTKVAISAPQAVVELKRMETPPKEIERFARRHIIRPDNGERLVKAKPGEDTGGALNRLGKALAGRGL